jgi:hypothetical protein
MAAAAAIAIAIARAALIAGLSSSLPLILEFSFFSFNWSSLSVEPFRYFSLVVPVCILMRTWSTSCFKFLFPF